MFNNFARIDENEYEFMMHTTRELCIVELIVEQIHATTFDDIYTMHVYKNVNDSTKFIVDCAFELHTNKFECDENNDVFEHKHNYDIRVNIDISNEQFDVNEICNTIEYVKCELIYRNAYKTIEYNAFQNVDAQFTFDVNYRDFN